MHSFIIVRMYYAATCYYNFLQTKYWVIVKPLGTGLLEKDIRYILSGALGKDNSAGEDTPLFLVK